MVLFNISFLLCVSICKHTVPSTVSFMCPSLFKKRVFEINITPPPKQTNQKQNKMSVSENSGTPQSSILIGFSIVFTIHFGVPSLLELPKYVRLEILDVMSLKKHLQEVEQCPEALKISNFAGRTFHLRDLGGMDELS